MEYKQFYRRKLPHIHAPGATLFVTFRLAGSIPKSVIEHWKHEKLWFEKEHERLGKDAAQSRTRDTLARLEMELAGSRVEQANSLFRQTNSLSYNIWQTYKPY